MLKKTSVLFLLFTLSASLHAQDGVKVNDNAGAYTETPANILLIPFEPKLYMSDIDKDVAEKEQLSFQDIRNSFRQGLNDNLFIEISKNGKVISMLTEDPEIQKDLRYIYMSVGYKYEVLMPDSNASGEKPTGLQSLVSKAKKAVEPKKEKPGTRVEKGQIVSHADNSERYMHTVIVNPKMIEYLTQKYGASLFVFVNQLNIEKAADEDYRALEAEDYKREVKAHYTIVDRSGKVIYGGAAKSWFSSKNNNISRIIKGNFPSVASQIGSKIPAVIASEAERKKREEEKKKAEEQEKNLLEQY